MQESGKDIKALNTRPTLLPALDFYFDAYRQLQYDRPVGMATGSIPWSSVIRWCHLHGIRDINDIDTVLRYIRAMEKAEYEFDERKENSKK